MKTIAVYCGGGIKGYTEAEFSKLMDIEADLWGGTSIGGIIACAKAGGKDWHAITRLFQDRGKNIFKRGWFHNSKLLWQSHRYSNKGLKKELKNFFGNMTMQSLKPVCVTAMSIENVYGPHYFSEKSADKVVDVCLATSAAPSYFPPHKGFVDGGLFMNNPVLYAYLKARRLWPQEVINVINIGSGESGLELGEAKNGVDLLDDLVQHFMQGNEMAAREIVVRFGKQLGINSYKYYDFSYDRKIALDETSDKAFESMRKAAYREHKRATER